MRFFTSKLWSQINDTDPMIRAQAEKEWAINGLEYQKVFSKAAKRLPRKFIKAYLNRKGLHDYAILEMLFKQKGRASFGILRLSNGLETVLVEMAGLKAVNIHAETICLCMSGLLTWGYDEIEVTPQNTIKLAILCDIQNELQFEFQSIKLVTQA